MRQVHGLRPLLDVPIRTALTLAHVDALGWWWLWQVSMSHLEAVEVHDTPEW